MRAAGGGAAISSAASSLPAGTHGAASGGIKPEGATCKVGRGEARRGRGSSTSGQRNQKRQKKATDGKANETGSHAGNCVEAAAGRVAGMGAAAEADGRGGENNQIKVVDGEVIDESKRLLCSSSLCC